MKTLGEFLRKAREAKGLTLEEVQEVTKIRQFFLESMENGNFDALPGQAYVKGFLRNYASAVGISEQEVIERYNQLTQAQSQVPETSAVEAKPKDEPVKTKAPKQKMPAAKDKRRNLYVPTVIVIIGIIAGVYGGRLIIGQHPKSGKSVTTVSQPTPVTPVVKPQKPQNKQVMQNSKFTDLLKVEATDTVWVRVTEQETGKIIEEVTLKKGDTRQWKLDRTLTLLSGNAGGLKVSDHGKAFEYHGNVGEVVTLTFSPQGHE